MRLTTLWPSGIQVDEAAEIEVFSRYLLDQITADPSVETSIAGDKLTIRATNGTWVYKLDRAGATVTEITGHLVSHRDTGSIDFYELEEETETPRFGDGFNLVLENVRAEARQTRNLIRRIMSDLQQHLDTDITALAAVLDQLEAEITSLKNGDQRVIVDFTAADALVAQAKALVAPAVVAAAPPATTEEPAALEQTTPVPLAGPTEVPAATVGAGYSATLVATGGTEPYSFAVEGLPVGLTASGGAISGTPQAAGDSTLAVTVTDSTGATATSSPVLTVS